MVDGAAPSLATTWDLGVLFNYNSSGAKKAAVAWEHNDGRFKFASEVTDGGGSGANNPQITFTEFAPIEVSALWVNDCAGQSQVINCSGTERSTVSGFSYSYGIHNSQSLPDKSPAIFDRNTLFHAINQLRRFKISQRRTIQPVLRASVKTNVHVSYLLKCTEQNT